jgi:EmrB/QacA subfamily drug resistance transporter
MGTPGSSSSSSERLSRALVASVTLAAVLIPLNATMIAVALPEVTRDLDVSVRASSWLVTGFVIVMAALQPVTGKLGDRLGRERLLRIGIWWFALASLGAALSPSLPVLMAFRVQQALAGAVVIPNATALVRERLPADRRGRALGLVGSAVALTAALGPVVGGALTAAASWRAVFAVNLPLAAVALVIGRRVAASPPARRPRVAPRPFDVLGALLLSVLLTCVAAVLSAGSELGAGAVAGGVVLVALGAFGFVQRELRHPEPVLQPRFFRNRAFSAVNAAAALSNLALYTILLGTPLMLAEERHWESGRIGLAIAALALAAVVVAPIGGRLADRVGRRPVAAAGLLAFSAGLLPLAAIGADIATIELVAALALAGAGLGASNPGLQAIALESLAERHAGVAAGLYQTSRYLGSLAAASLLGAIVGTGAGGGYEALFAVGVAAALASFLSVLTAPADSARARPAAAAT